MKIKIIIIGANYYGSMAGNQRIRNLFEPLLSKNNVEIGNLIINDNEKIVCNGNVMIKQVNYDWRNPWSLLLFLILVGKYLFNEFDGKKSNYIYHYGYPSIEDIFFLKFAQFTGFKIVYDIAENILFFNNTKASLRMKFKNFTSSKLLNQLCLSGSLCFGISNRIVQYLKSICKGRVPVVHLPISVNTAFVESFLENGDVLGDNNSEISVFYGGSFGYKDGIDVLIKALELACEQNDNLQLILTGKVSKDMNDILPSLINKSKCFNKIQFLGFLSISDYFKTMVNSDILCMPRVDSEYANAGFPFKLGEYLASGKPVIATEVSDIHLYLKNMQNALTVRPGSDKEICEAIIKLAKDSELRRKIGGEGKQTAISNFGPQNVSEILWDNLCMLAKVDSCKNS